MKFLITGGAGFIGSAVVRHIIQNTEHEVLNVDKLTYAGNLESLISVADHPRYHFSQTDICDRAALDQLFSDFQPDVVMHLAAESHVDRSISGPFAFIETNIIGTYQLLEASRSSNCSNNYGPYHFPEKLIPLMILNALQGKALPVYGNGQQIRDWLFVEDHARALYVVATQGVVGETYNIGGHNEKANLDVVHAICQLLEELAPNKPEGIQFYQDLITYVKDRPGHDVRYAIDASKIKAELGWVPEESFETGLRKTVEWYLSNTEWVQHVQSGEYQSWLSTQYQG